MNPYDDQFKKIKYLFIDLDGTLLNSQRTISEENITAVKTAANNGLNIVLTSGRISTMITLYREILGLNGYVISSNDAYIEDTAKKRTVFKKYVTYMDALNLVSYCLIHDIECSILTRKACYFSKNSLRIDRFTGYNDLAKSYQSELIDIKIYFKPFNEMSKVEKLLIQCRDPQKVADMLRYIQSTTKIQVTSSDEYIYDCSAKDVSKGHAVSWLMSKLKLKEEEVIVFGDYDNDVSMFKVAGISVAMKNGSEQAKKAADIIAESNDEHGVALIINQILKAKGLQS